MFFLYAVYTIRETKSNADPLTQLRKVFLEENDGLIDISKMSKANNKRL